MIYLFIEAILFIFATFMFSYNHWVWILAMGVIGTFFVLIGRTEYANYLRLRKRNANR